MQAFLGGMAAVAFLMLGACASANSSSQISFANGESILSGAGAHWISANILLWDTPSEAASFEIRYSQSADIFVSNSGVTGGEVVRVTGQGSPFEWNRDKYRHIAHWPVYQVEADRDVITRAIKGQVVAIAFDASGSPIAATAVQFPGVIDEFFQWDGELGPVYDEDTIRLTVWAPTAQSLSLNIYDADKNRVETVEAVTRSPQDGHWVFSGPRSKWDRMFYRFAIEVYHPANNLVNSYEVTDPYSVSLSTNSRYSQFVNLSDANLKPQGWDQIRKKLPRPVDITLYEAHLRDFSVLDRSVPAEHRGTYLAFTYNGKNGRALSAGMRHLKALAEAGLTHLHLLPLNDITTVNEDLSGRVDLDDPYQRICDVIGQERFLEDCARYGDTPIIEVFEKLASENPITESIQAPYNRLGRYEDAGHRNGLANYDGFNWGYDPWHFNAPEGSYSTDPDGVTRILELREMVKALNEIGLKIVVDVVYNHTSGAGLVDRSVLDRVVPGYYQRLDPVTGRIETSTCCPNTASEHYMMERLMIDSIVLWAREYKIDSFRFDLMGHHPLSTMILIQEALAELTLEKDGVDGTKVYIYGEGWNFGEVADNRIFDQATQFMTAGTGIGNFNDRLRDGIRGRNFTDVGRFQGFVSGQYLFPNVEAGEDKEAQKAALFQQADNIRVGLAGNLRTYPYQNRTGEIVPGGHEGIGYTLLPQENVNYIDKHDNETLWDNTQTKLPGDMPMDARVRIHNLSNAFINYGQGVPFYQMGTDILRSKSLDRNSYDSGDWFNRVDFTMETHNWGTGMPPAWDNQNRWDDIRPILANPVIQVTKTHMEFAHQQFLEQLRIRYSSPLFRLESAEEVHKRVMFHNTGPHQVPGLIIMSISDGAEAGADLDPNLDGIMVVFNASDKTELIHLANLKDYQFELHPIQQTGSDDVVRTSSITEGLISVPAHTAAVFIKKQQGTQGSFPINIWE